MTIDHWLTAIPPLAVYVTVALVVGVESLGVPLPGEIALVSAAFMASRPEAAVSPLWVACAGLAGAVVGDSIGYAIGRRYGTTLFGWLGRKFPRHAGPAHLALAERAFARWGVLTVVVGRFVAVLRIFAGPLAGALRMPYAKFVPANATGGLLWTAGTVFGIYFLGMAAEVWLKRFSVVGLVAVVVVGLLVGIAIRRRVTRLVEEQPVSPAEPGTSTGS